MIKNLCKFQQVLFMLLYNGMKFFGPQSARHLQTTLKAGKDQSRFTGWIATEVKNTCLFSLLQCSLKPYQQLTGQVLRLFTDSSWQRIELCFQRTSQADLAIVGAGPGIDAEEPIQFFLRR